MKSAAPSLLKRFETKRRLVASDILKTQKDALQQLLQEGRVVHVRAYYLAGHAPTVESERKRIVEKLLTRPRLFRQSSLKSNLRENQPYFRSALSDLVDKKEVIKLGVVGDAAAEYFIHRDHLLQFLGSIEVRAAKSDELEQLTTDATTKISSQIRCTYEQVANEKGRRSIFISDLLQASGLSWQELRGWIEKEVVEAGHGQLDEGDWNAATEEQRAAAVDLWGRKRLYIALP
jgi:hypothetical protein